MMKWEYKVVKYREVMGTRSQERYFDRLYRNSPIEDDGHPTRRDLTVDCLNLLGDDGWELITYNPPHRSFSIAIFKRPKNQE